MSVPKAPDPKNVRRVYLIGICGTGMGSLAGMLKSVGYEVTGSDENVYPPMSLQLAKLGIPILEGYDPKHLEPLPDLVVVGNVIRRENPEAQAAINHGIPYCSMPEIITRFFLENKRVAMITGTHGKTTTTALLSHVLLEAGRNPTFLIGGVMRGHDLSYRIGEGETVVVEGDEYDTAFFDKVPKFWRYKADIAVLANVEFDHADIYPDMDAVRAAFSGLVSMMPENGVIVAGIDCPEVRKLLDNAHCKVLGFGLNEMADYHGKIVRIFQDSMVVELNLPGKSIPDIEVPLIGEHNLKNILAVVACADLFGIKSDSIIKGLSSFQGVMRRQEIKGEVAGIIVMDDFAHHPTALAVTLKSLKARFPSRRIIAVFEPRTATSRRNVFQREYPPAFKEADIAILAPVFRPEQINIGSRFDVHQLLKDIRSFGIDAYESRNYDDILALLASKTDANDLVVFFSNGGFGGLPAKFLKYLADESARKNNHD